MEPGKQNRARAWVVGAAIVLGLTASCSAADDDVPTLSEPNVAVSIDTATQEGRAAEAMYTCLTERKIPATLAQTGLGEPYIDVFATGRDSVYLKRPGGSNGSYPNGQNDADARVEEAIEASGEDYGFSVNAVDRSADLRQCLESSGYEFPPVGSDAALELEIERFMADQGTAWAACAREHGLTGVADPSPGPLADGGATSPIVKLPASVTPEQLRPVLEACPPLSEETMAYSEELWQRLPNPELGTPGVEFHLSAADEASEAETRAILDLIEEFRSETRQSFYDRQDQ
ncbi:MAG: hypothetical protein LBJ08_05170 [Bifidobacteriaceae bacterium]|jgi:hypothetical protein|nr:hypothetical protein [Bifidobacteriaceae bacterium]